MMLVLEIGGISIGVEHDSPGWDRLLRCEYVAYISSRSPEFVVNARVVPGFRTGATDVPVSLTPQGGGRYKLLWFDTEGVIDSRSGRADVTLSDGVRSICNVMSNLLALVIHRKGGLLLHAASFVREGTAYVFPGVSTAGKTTLAGLTLESRPECTLLTDEISLVRRDGNRWLAHGTPFHGEIGRNGENVSAPVGRICFIEKSRRHVLTPLDAAGAYSRLVQNTLHAVHERDGIASAMLLASEIVGMVPAGVLGFKKDAGFWGLL